MTVKEVFHTALKATPYPVTQPPVKGDKPVYLAFFEVLAQPTSYASNRPQHIRHTMQVDIYARQQVGPELDVVVKALRAAGIHVDSWGPEDYETDTRWHHLPITCFYTESTETEE